MTRQEIMLAHRSSYYDLIVYKKLLTLVDKCGRYSKPKQTQYTA